MNKIKKTPISINRGQLQKLRFTGSRHLSLVCSEGTAWITTPGDAKDYILSAGDRIELQVGRGTLVVESMSNHLELDVQSA